MTAVCSFENDARDRAKSWEEKDEMQEKRLMLKVTRQVSYMVTAPSQQCFWEKNE